ncbi:MAG: PAS domain S-box protein [Elusimicrobia bacterium]|nr:PAS domain S-box protein [Elusimicrobiota bacterium]
MNTGDDEAQANLARRLFRWVEGPDPSPRRFARALPAAAPASRAGFLGAAVLPFAAAAVQAAFWPVIMPFTWFLFYPAAFLAPWIGGPWAGLLAVLESAALGWYYFMPAGKSGYAALATVGMFSGMGILFCAVHGRLRAVTREWRSASEELAEFFEQASEGIFIADAAGRYLDVNAAGCRLLGRPREAILGRAIAGLIPPAQRKIGGVQVAERDLQRDDGTSVPVEVSSSLLPDGRWQAFVRDITERRRAEDAMRRLAELKRRDEFQMALESAANAMVMVDARGRIVLTNAEADKLFGYARGELVGRSLETLVPERFKGPHRGQCESFFAGGAGKRSMGASRALQALRKDGSEFPADIGLTRVGLEDEKFVVTSVIDVSERIAFEQRLLQSEERLRLLVQNVKDYAIFMHDVEGKVTVWNEGAERILGYRAEEILGHNFSVFYTPEDAAAGRHEADLAAAVERGSLQRDEWRLRKDGSRFLANVVVTPVYGADGRLVGFGKVLRDLTEVRKAEAALKDSAASLRRSVEDLEAFAYTASHDLRSPLRAIQGYAHFARERLKDKSDPETLGMLDRIGGSAIRLDRLIRDVLSYSAIAREEVTLSPIDLDRIVEHVLNLYPNLTAAGLEVRRPLGAVMAQESLMLQIVSNLLVNAVKFVPAGREPAIEVRTEAAGGGKLRLIVEDNGPGIPRVHWERIFKPFERLPDARATAGSGIGLAIVKRAVERLGGRITVESEPCTGTRFTVELEEARHVG